MSSSSSEFSVFSGHQPTKSPEKSTFSQTCSLLSQYLKENRNFGELALGLTDSNSTTTMDLFPTNVRSQNLTTLNLFSPNTASEVPTMVNSTELKKVNEAKSAKLTIFYDGRVIVFDDFPAEKVEEIITLAKKETPQSESAYGYSQNNQPSIVRDLPIARKASLHRFLEKRKDRISAKAPYQILNKPTSGSVKPVESIPWLGLGVKARQI